MPWEMKYIWHVSKYSQIFCYSRFQFLKFHYHGLNLVLSHAGWCVSGPQISNAIENFDTDMVLYFLHSYLYLTLQLSHITKNEKHYPVLLLSLWNFKRLRKKRKGNQETKRPNTLLSLGVSIVNFITHQRLIVWHSNVNFLGCTCIDRRLQLQTDHLLIFFKCKFFNYILKNNNWKTHL